VVRGTALLLVITGIAAVGSSSASSAFSGGAAASPAADRIARQEQIHAVTDPLWARVIREHTPGFTSIVNAEDASSFTVYWKGTPPAWVIGMLAASTGPRGRIASAAFSEAELQAGVERLLGRGSTKNYRLGGIYPNSDGSGLTAEVMPQASSASLDTVDRKAAKTQLTAKVGIPVGVTVARTSPKASATRYDDSPPWEAGGVADRLPDHACSLGFAIRLASGPASGQVRLLSAAHCAGAEGTIVVDGGNDAIGTISIQAYNYDSELINPTSGTSG
jgi:hypothetical protein